MRVCSAEIRVQNPKGVQSPYDISSLFLKTVCMHTVLELAIFTTLPVKIMHFIFDFRDTCIYILITPVHLKPKTGHGIGRLVDPRYCRRSAIWLIDLIY